MNFNFSRMCWACKKPALTYPYVKEMRTLLTACRAAQTGTCSCCCASLKKKSKNKAFLNCNIIFWANQCSRLLHLLTSSQCHTAAAVPARLAYRPFNAWAACYCFTFSVCMSEPSQTGTAPAIQALHCAHLQSALHIARLSGDWVRPIFNPPL